jgi:hypothetical protein
LHAVGETFHFRAAALTSIARAVAPALRITGPIVGVLLLPPVWIPCQNGL